MSLKHFYSGAVLSAAGALGFYSHHNDQSCASATFSALGLPDIEIISLNVTVSLNESVAGQNALGDANIISAPTGNGPSNVDLCRITVKYAHPGQNDTINTYTGLPLDPNNWDSRFVMNGGGIWVAGTPDVVLESVSNGFASTSADGGHDNSLQVSEWGLTSPVRANIVVLKDFASVALEKAAKLGTSATLLCYGIRPEYPYWNGCSTGGRQGVMAAQRFPEEFDDIIAACPGINWNKFPLYEFWPVLMSNILGTVQNCHPLEVSRELMILFDVRAPACVLQDIKADAIAAYDDMDGVKDGSISLPGRCRFDAMCMVGQTVNCTAPEGTIQITENMSELVSFL